MSQVKVEINKAGDIHIDGSVEDVAKIVNQITGKPKQEPSSTVARRIMATKSVTRPVTHRDQYPARRGRSSKKRGGRYLDAEVSLLVALLANNPNPDWQFGIANVINKEFRTERGPRAANAFKSKAKSLGIWKSSDEACRRMAPIRARSPLGQPRIS